MGCVQAWQPVDSLPDRIVFFCIGETNADTIVHSCGQIHIDALAASPCFTMVHQSLQINTSLTWNKAVLGILSPNHHSSEVTTWGRYNLPMAQSDRKNHTVTKTKSTTRCECDSALCDVHRSRPCWSRGYPLHHTERYTNHPHSVVPHHGPRRRQG